MKDAYVRYVLVYQKLDLAFQSALRLLAPAVAITREPHSAGPYEELSIQK